MKSYSYKEVRYPSILEEEEARLISRGVPPRYVKSTARLIIRERLKGKIARIMEG